MLPWTGFLFRDVVRSSALGSRLSDAAVVCGDFCMPCACLIQRRRINSLNGDLPTQPGPRATLVGKLPPAFTALGQAQL